LRSSSRKGARALAWRADNRASPTCVGRIEVDSSGNGECSKDLESPSKRGFAVRAQHPGSGPIVIYYGRLRVSAILWPFAPETKASAPARPGMGWPHARARTTARCRSLRQNRANSSKGGRAFPGACGLPASIGVGIRTCAPRKGKSAGVRFAGSKARESGAGNRK
jgi:hypothetical protein